jgi:hypothetical protein
MPEDTVPEKKWDAEQWWRFEGFEEYERCPLCGCNDKFESAFTDDPRDDYEALMGVPQKIACQQCLIHADKRLLRKMAVEKKKPSHTCKQCGCVLVGAKVGKHFCEFCGSARHINCEWRWNVKRGVHYDLKTKKKMKRAKKE